MKILISIIKLVVICLAIIVDSVEEANALYEKLTVNAQEIVMEMQEMFWSPAYANFIDQFGIMWQINTELAQ